MKQINWQVRLGVSFVVLSAVLYLIHFAIYRDAKHIFIYLLGDIAFVPINVLLVTLIIDRLLTRKEKRAMLEKMNMVIGAFFSEVGTRLLGYFSPFDPELEKIRKELIVTNEWSYKEFLEVANRLKKYEYPADARKGDLTELKKFLTSKTDFMLRLLENPNLLEHDSFTQLLWAVFHLAEELANRTNLVGLPDSDVAHLSGDIKRVYSRLVCEWLDYMRHLKRNYPYLFSLALRTNPFNPAASAVVT